MDSEFSTIETENEWVETVEFNGFYNDNAIPKEIMVPYSFNVNNNSNNSINSNTTISTSNQNLSNDADEVSCESHAVAGVKSSSSTSNDFKLACRLQKEEKKRLTLKPPPLPPGDYMIAFNLQEKERELEESDWNNARSLINPKKKRKQSSLVSFSKKV